MLRGERVGVVGENGAGKSVLLRVLGGELEPDEGERKAGPSIRFGRLAQDRRPDDPKATPLELVRHAAPISEGEAVSRLMKFLFAYEQVRRPLESLSGGEWTRLQLLLLMLEGANCLLLDEPTNHLDIESVEMLEAALESFDGHRDLRLARPLLPRPHRRPDPRGLGRRRSLVRGRLVDLARAPGRRGLACGGAQRRARHRADDADELLGSAVGAGDGGDRAFERRPSCPFLCRARADMKLRRLDAGRPLLEVRLHRRHILGMHDARRATLPSSSLRPCSRASTRSRATRR